MPLLSDGELLDDESRSGMPGWLFFVGKRDVLGHGLGLDLGHGVGDLRVFA